MEPIKFIHAADLHLDSPMVGLKDLPDFIFERLKESTFRSFIKLIDVAISEKVDFVILAGDLYDASDRSIKAQNILREQMLRLHKARIRAFIVHGNHDHLGGEWIKLTMPENVFIFGEIPEVTRFKKNDTIIHLYGFSYKERHVDERMVQLYQKEEAAGYHIGILHGNLEGLTEHGNYAPFTISDLIEKQFDYWALGHIHKRAEINTVPPIIYPGNIQGRHKKETGIKGCYLIELQEHICEKRFIETNDVVWDEVVLDCSSFNSFEVLLSNCIKLLESKRREGKAIILKLELQHLSMSEIEEKAFRSGELIEFLQETERIQQSFVWVNELKVKKQLVWDEESLRSQSPFYKEMLDLANEEIVLKALSPLYRHKQASRWIDELSLTDQKEIVADAKQLLLELLVEGVNE